MTLEVADWRESKSRSFRCLSRDGRLFLRSTITITTARTWPWVRVFRTHLPNWPLGCRSHDIDLMR